MEIRENQFENLLENFYGRKSDGSREGENSADEGGSFLSAPDKEKFFSGDTNGDRYKRAIIADALLVYEFNLTKDRILGTPFQRVGNRIIELKKMLGLGDDCKYSEFIEAICWDMSENEKKEFLEKMNVYCLLDSFIMERYEIQFDSRRISYNGDFFWTRNTVILTKDEESGDIMGLVIVKNVTTDYRENEKKLYQLEVINALSKEYSNVFMLNLASGRIRVIRINEKEGSFFNENFSDGFYDDALNFYIGVSVYEEDRDMMHQAFSRKNIFRQLHYRESFNVNFRTKINDKISFMKLAVVRIGDINKSGNVLLGFMNVDNEIAHEMNRRKVLQEALSMAESANNAKTRFLSNMSHDIRTPLNAIIGFTSIAENHLDNPDLIREDLKRIKSSSTHLLSLINDVLDMSRIESGRMKIMLKPNSIEDIVYEVENVVKPQIDSKKLNYSLVKKGNLQRAVFCDKLRLSQVLINILGNAVKYTNEGGTIKFTVNEMPPITDGFSSYQFRIKDNGIGMSKEFQKKKFTPFERDENLQNYQIQGTGLGLAISKTLVEKMDGSIFLNSEEGVGTEFLLCFDFENSAEETVQKREEKKVDVAKFSGVRILLVEDNNLNREIARELLKNAGFVIDEAENGKIAVEKINSAEPDFYKAVLMDVMMPVMNGYDATKKIRSLPDEKKSAVPIVAMTANAFEEDKAQALEAGMSAFVSKPFNINDLLRVLSEIVGGEK
jgi:signal transduction histidine kinase/ActR/RegA family two-component response regulator